MNDLLKIAFDYNPPDVATMIVSRNDGETISILNTFTNADAIGLHDLLTGYKGDIVPQRTSKEQE